VHSSAHGTTGRRPDRLLVVVVAAALVASPACAVAGPEAAPPPVPVGSAATTAPLVPSPATPTPSGPVLGPPTDAPPAPSSEPPAEPVDEPATTAAPPAAPSPAPSVTPTPPPPAEPGTGSATPAPEWLGTRVLGPAGSGPVPPQTTPEELLDRRIVTTDVLPPPLEETFRSAVVPVPPAVLARSTWQPECPVAATDLRYVRVAFWGFDGRHHTGELLLHADAVDAVVAVFAAMHAERFPLEEVRVIRPDELDAAPTGDGNTTSAFVCRPVTGGSGWSQHAYGRAVDVNPFHNPYERGTGDDRVVIPELATAYTDRDRVLPGMVTEGSVVVRAFRDAGWGWGGDYRSSKDWMHFSATGG
jgi:hypothetical protein